MIRPLLGVGVALLGWWMAFRGTPDLGALDRRTEYRVALMFFYMGGLTWLLDVLGWI